MVDTSSIASSVVSAASPTSTTKPAAGTLTFSPNETTKTVAVDLLNTAEAGQTKTKTFTLTLSQPNGGKINTNEFARLAPGIDACALMYCDMAAPREIPTPLPGGAIDVLSEWRMTSGWVVRPEAVTLISMVYQ